LGKVETRRIDFTGREPDEERWNFDEPKFDSYAGRISFAPTEAWTLQASYGWINSPELLHPDVNTERITATVAYHVAWEGRNWQTLFAWGQNRNHPGENLDGFLIESLIRFDNTHTVFSRAERVQKDELFPPGHALEHEKFTVHKVSLGYIYDFPKISGVTMGVGGVGSVHFLPGTLRPPLRRNAHFFHALRPPKALTHASFRPATLEDYRSPVEGLFRRL
jgi:hypothetical protein